MVVQTLPGGGGSLACRRFCVRGRRRGCRPGGATPAGRLRRTLTSPDPSPDDIGARFGTRSFQSVRVNPSRGISEVNISIFGAFVRLCWGQIHALNSWFVVGGYPPAPPTGWLSTTALLACLARLPGSPPLRAKKMSFPKIADAAHMYNPAALRGSRVHPQSPETKKRQYPHSYGHR